VPNTWLIATQERRRHIGAVIHVLRQREAWRAFRSRQTNRIDIQEQTGRAGLVGRFRIEDVRLAKAQIEGLKAIRMFVQQEARIARRAMSCSESEEHAELNG
jgi:hypothetical protein